MKKLLKALAVLSTVLGVISAINHIILLLAELERRKHKNRGKIFEWTYGKVSYTVNGHGTPLLLIHGLDMGSSRAEWEASIAALSKNYMVYAVDLLGYGNSQKPKITYSSYLYSKLLADFIKSVVGKPVFAAACRGSAPVLLAACSLLPAGAVKKIILVSPSHNCRDCYTKHKVLLRTLIHLPVIGTAVYNMMTSKAATKAMLKEYGYFREVTSDKVNRFYYPAHYGKNARFAAADNFGGFFAADTVSLARSVNIPVRCIAGGHDKTGLTFIKKLSEGNKNITVSIFQNARVLPHDENPNGFVRTCRAFFGV